MTDYDKAIMVNVTIGKLLQKLESGKFSSADLNRLAGEYGRVAGKCMSAQLLKEFPEGNVPEEDVRRIISPILQQNHRYVSEAAAAFQTKQYEKAGVGLKAINPDYNISREDDLVKEISLRSFADGLER